MSRVRKVFDNYNRFQNNSNIDYIIIFRAVIFRLGRILQIGAKGPGLFFV